MTNQLTTMGLLLGLTLSSTLAMAADAKTYILECGVSQTIAKPDGHADRVPLAPTKYIEISDSGSMEIPFHVMNSTQVQDVVLHVDTIIQNIPDFPQEGQVYIDGSMQFVLDFKTEGRSFSTMVGSTESIPILQSGISFNIGSNYYGAGCSVTPKENYVFPEPTPAK